MSKVNERNFITLSCFFLFFDSVNGFFLTLVSYDLKISIIYKLIYLFLALLFLARKNKFYFHISLCLVFYSIAWSLLQNILGSGRYFFSDFSEIIKLFYTFIIFFTFASFKETCPERSLIKIAIFSSVILTLNVITGYLGFGYTSYENYGYKGFFYAGNALSGVLIIIFSFLLFANHIKNKHSISSFLFFVFIAVMLGTKSTMLGLFLLLSLVYFRLTDLKSLLSISLILSLSIFLIYTNIEAILNSAIFARMTYFYENGGFVRVVLSGRNEFLDNIYPFYLNSNAAELFFGLGFEELRSNGKPLVEMDFFDILFLFGISTFVFYIFSIFLYISLTFKKSTHVDGVRVIYSALIVLLLIAFIAGHILFNGLVTPFLGILLAIPYWQYNHSVWSKEINE